MTRQSNGRWFAFTPAGTMVATTEARTKKKCIKKLMREAAHMPYQTWADFLNRGYTVKYLERVS